MSDQARYRVTVGQSVFDITVESGADGLASVDGERHEIAWHPRERFASTLRLDRHYRAVNLRVDAPGEALVALEGYQAAVHLAEARALQLAASVATPRPLARRVEVRAPMPGRVLALRVTPGVPVARGAVVAILEAMKMENALQAPQDGIVASIHVREGDVVEHGALLLVLDPPDSTQPDAARPPTQEQAPGEAPTR